MSQIPSLMNTAAGQAGGSGNSLNDLDLDTFLELMIAELQNQDPLNPMDNSQLLAQISQIREVGATDKLTETLNSVLLGQNISSSTNLIGSDIIALSDDDQRVSGVVDRVTIDGGQPKLHLELDTDAVGSSAEGNIEAGTYGYHIVWENANGELFGLDMTGENAVTTTGTNNLDKSIQISNLPITDGPKYVYRTDSSGSGNYQLVSVLTEGSQGSYTDRLSDKERSGTRLTQPFQHVSSFRTYQVSLNNVSEIRPPQFPLSQ